MKKLYQTPKIQVYGNVEKITLGGSGGDADFFTGNNGVVSPGDDDGGCVKQINPSTLDFGLCSVGMGQGS